MSELTQAALNSKAWPFQEARQLHKRVQRQRKNKEFVIFQTGFGPSGLPHIGTFGEVARTTMVRHAFETISDQPTKLICFSDDLDGFRKVPENIPNQEMMQEDLNLPLCKVRDPFEKYQSFAAYNNAMLCSFLDQFRFEYEFLSSANCYQQGMFDDMLIRTLERFDDVMAVMLPSLGGVTKGRTDSYSPFLPISPKSGRVLQVPTLERNPSKGTIVYQEPDGEKVEISVLGGQVKLQWKPDWAMRWVTLQVDYEMYGKDLIPSAELGVKLCRELGGIPPIGMAYELFLDENGQKISKSKGTGGITVDEWLSFATAESLSSFMFQKPKTAKRLYAEIIPKAVDEYHQHLENYPRQQIDAQLSNPVWHIHNGNPPSSTMTVPYSMLLNLASVSSAKDEDILWGFIKKYEPTTSVENCPDLAVAVRGAIEYFHQQILPSRKFINPSVKQKAALLELQWRLWFWNREAEADTIQTLIYAIGRKHKFEPMKDWFMTIYQVLFGVTQGPRVGGFTAIYGVQELAGLISERLIAASIKQNYISSYIDDQNNLVLPALMYLANQKNGSSTLTNLKLELTNSVDPRSSIKFNEIKLNHLSIKKYIDQITNNHQSVIFTDGLVEWLQDSNEVQITDKGRQYIEIN